MSLQEYIDNDPTLCRFINGSIDPDHFDHQVSLRCAALKVAMANYIEKYSYKYFSRSGK